MFVQDEILLAKSAKDYVKDGLVCWLDGINNTRAGHDASSNYWEDLSGNGNDFVKYYRGGAYANYLVLLDNAYSFQSTSSDAYTLYSNAFEDGILGTYEFVFSSAISGENLRAVFAHQFSAGVCFVKYSNGTVNLATNTEKLKYTSVADEFTDKINTFSLVPWSALYKNGVQVPIDGSSKTSTRADGGFYIGGLWQNNVGQPRGAWLGNVYSVRLYNRALTAAEIVHNAAVDRRRFGTGGTV